MKGDHHAPDGRRGRATSLVSLMKKLVEFRSKISKHGEERYYINIPQILNKVAKEYHGKYVYVVVYSLEEEEEEKTQTK